MDGFAVPFTAFVTELSRLNDLVKACGRHIHTHAANGSKNGNALPPRCAPSKYPAARDRLRLQTSREDERDSESKGSDFRNAGGRGCKVFRSQGKGEIGEGWKNGLEEKEENVDSRSEKDE